jgi:hypothetical protein
MKNYQYLLTLVIVFVISSCGKKEDIKPKSTFTANLNGKMWEGNKVSSVLREGNELGIGILTYENGFEREALTFSRLLLSVGKQELIKYYTDSTTHLGYGTSYGTSQDDGDVGCDLYNLYTPDSLVNYIDIRVYDAEKKYIEGTYSATYLREKKNGVCAPSKPDTLRFRDGYFAIYF